MKRSKHNLSHYKLLTCNQGELVPIAAVEVLPGDTFRHATSLLERVNTLDRPVMTPVHATVHHWFVPYRLIWQDFEDFITGGPDGDNASTPPYVTTPAETGFAIGSLADYLGVRPGVASQQVSALPFRAYALIWNHFYRDEDLQTALTISKASGSDTTTNTALQNVCWEKDYFTSARPEPQKGPDVMLPLGTSAPVVRSGTNAAWGTLRADTGAGFSGSGLTALSSPAAKLGSDSAVPLQLDPADTLEVDLTEAGAVSINELRELSAIQRFEENMMRHGSRYIERLLQMGVKSSDARLQLPEYLGGGSQTVQFSEVLGTDSTNLGDMGGHGIAALRSNRYERFFEEHGILISLMYTKPKTLYVDGIHKMWSRETKFDFFQPELQHIGQQPVLNKEVYFAADGQNDSIFGWQDPYDSYRRIPSSIAGDFRDEDDNWHMARMFDTRPALNADFVKANPTNRVYSDQNASQLRIMAFHVLLSRRLLAKRGTSFLS